MGALLTPLQDLELAFADPNTLLIHQLVVDLHIAVLKLCPALSPHVAVTYASCGGYCYVSVAVFVWLHSSTNEKVCESVCVVVFFFFFPHFVALSRVLLLPLFTDPRRGFTPCSSK